LAETQDEERFCLELFGHRPVAYMESVDWIGDDVWFAHSVHVNDAEIALYARTGCGVAHCPSSNMRLASGIAPVRKYRSAGVKVGLGVDGSASNDGSHMLGEARQAMLLSRLGSALEGASLSTAEGKTVPVMSAREALEIATLGGASVLGRADIGALAPGKCADFFAINLNRLDYAGAWHDPVAAVVFCAPQNADYTYVHGRAVVKEGQVVTVAMGGVIEHHNRIARKMVNGE
jgi:cytosine/adenosine deaminase-related metal-dependent hydrolase